VIISFENSIREFRDPDPGGVLSVVFWQPPVEDTGPWHRLTALTIAAGKPGSSGSDSLPVRLPLCTDSEQSLRALCREQGWLHIKGLELRLAGVGRAGTVLSS